jgi:hypothetical protein
MKMEKHEKTEAEEEEILKLKWNTLQTRKSRMSLAIYLDNPAWHFGHPG